tara:strand:+ start:251 stop:829 length:579 start_codon:yes stop_codon:yes gene_type:complete
MSGEVLAVIAIASAVAGSAAAIEGAKAQKKMYERQADITERQGRLDALNYKQQGVNAIKKMNRVMAANAARAAAGNLDPYASYDSADVIGTYNLRMGVNDFTIARDNASIAKKMSKYQADNYRYAGQVAVNNAKRMAVINIGQSFVTAGMVYGTPGLTGMFSSSTAAANTTSNVVPSSLNMPNYGNTGNFIV